MITRMISASRDIVTKMSLKEQEKIEIYSFFPIDKANCDCKTLIHEWKEKLRMLPPHKREDEIIKQGHIECPRSKVGTNRYKITCSNCKQIVGYCRASDDTLKDWFDFHYVSWTNGEQWYGCFTPHVSPIDERLCIECTCGADTRDFRPNMTLPGKVAYEMEERNKIGRDFGRTDSKFKTTLMKTNRVTFNKPISAG